MGIGIPFASTGLGKEQDIDWHLQSQAGPATVQVPVWFMGQPLVAECRAICHTRSELRQSLSQFKIQ